MILGLCAEGQVEGVEGWTSGGDSKSGIVSGAGRDEGGGSDGICE